MFHPWKKAKLINCVPVFFCHLFQLGFLCAETWGDQALVRSRRKVNTPQCKVHQSAAWMWSLSGCWTAEGSTEQARNRQASVSHFLDICPCENYIFFSSKSHTVNWVNIFADHVYSSFQEGWRRWRLNSGKKSQDSLVCRTWTLTVILPQRYTIFLFIFPGRCVTKSQ